jgi:hypothetical protein
MKVNSVSMKVNSTVSKILTNKWVLNIISFLALFNVIGYMVMGNFNNVIFFIILAVLVRNFSHNMIIVLGTPLLIVNLFAMRNGTFEGLTSMEPKTDATTTGATTTDATTTDTSTGKKEQDKTKKTIDSPMKTGTEAPEIITADVAKKDSFEVGRSKNGAAKIDYASTIEDAYDDLNKILGSDGIKRLTSDTQGLMKQQMQLAESMKGMGPIIENIKPMMEQMKGMMAGMDGKDGLKPIMDIAKKLTSSMNATQ